MKNLIIEIIRSYIIICESALFKAYFAIWIVSSGEWRIHDMISQYCIYRLQN